MAEAKKVIKVAKPVKAQGQKSNALRLLATLCYFYPQYTLAEARKLPHKRVVLLVNTAQRMEATKMYNLTQIASAPHSKNGKGVKKLLDHFKKLAEV